MNTNTEYIGKVSLDYSLYKGEDLYKDGSEEELLSIVQNTSADGYNNVIRKKLTWPILYHLSDIRGNIVDFLPITGDDEVLEIGAGCGAITGTLAKHAGHVDCIELSRARSLVNATRNKDRDNISILVGNFQDIEKTLTKKYDYITLIGVLEYAASYIASNKPYEEFLSIIKTHLKPSGRLIIAIENKYGLKYWAGCREDHLATFMSGLEGYKDTDGVKTFSRGGLSKLLDSVGLADTEFYYPYPDYKLPLSVYSDDYLPAKGSLNNNFRNFDNDRMLLFDETRVFDNLIDDGLFPEFSNSFLVSAGFDKSDKPEKVIFSKFSNDRNEAYKIRTDIYEKNGRREVYKCGLSSGGAGHIAAMEKLYGKLALQADNTAFEINKSSVTEKGLELEYLTGDTLESLLDEALHSGDKELFLKLVADYTQNVRALATEDFKASDTYFEVFGENAYNGLASSMKVSDIDMIFANVIVSGDKNTLIDYEWSFDFPVPVDFVLYRTLHYYMYTGREQLLNSADIDMFTAMGIDASLEDIYMSMERSFQDYIIRDNTPLWKLYELMGKRFYMVAAMVEAEKNRASSVIKILNDESTVSENPHTVQTGENTYTATFRVDKDVKTILFCPAFESCVMKLDSIKAVMASGESYEPRYMVSGVTYEDDVTFFKENNPHILTDDLRDGINRMILEYRLVTCGDAMKDELEKVFALFPERERLKAEKESIISEDYSVVIDLQNQLENAENELNAMRNSTSWKVTEPARKLKSIGKE